MTTYFFTSLVLVYFIRLFQTIEIILRPTVLENFMAISTRGRSDDLAALRNSTSNMEGKTKRLSILIARKSEVGGYPH